MPDRSVHHARARVFRVGNHGSAVYLYSILIYQKKLFALSICTRHIKVFRHKRTSQPTGPFVAARGHKLVSGATVAGGGSVRVRYQRGYLRLGPRKNGPDRWEFLWWDSEPPECASGAKLSLTPSSSIQIWKTFGRQVMACACRSMRLEIASGNML